jgi:hypothetical protein
LGRAGYADRRPDLIVATDETPRTQQFRYCPGVVPTKPTFFHGYCCYTALVFGDMAAAHGYEIVELSVAMRASVISENWASTRNEKTFWLSGQHRHATGAEPACFPGSADTGFAL